MIYLDMDGVIADFFGHFAKTYKVDHWKSVHDKEKAILNLKHTNWFFLLPTFSDETGCVSTRIVEFTKQKAVEYNTGWGICSSPLRDDHNNSAFWKRLWLTDKKFMPNVEDCIFTSNKHRYATSKLDGKPNILVDDKPENIRRWEKAGGIGIRFQCDKDDVEEYLFPAIENALKLINNL